MPDPSTPQDRTAFRSALRKAAYDLPSPPAECEAEMRLHDFSDGSMAYLTCDLDRRAHAGLNHHDPTFGIWWNGCTLEDHGHTDPDSEGLRARDRSPAIRLLEAALHLRMNGERAPGGNETWAQLWRDVEEFLRKRLDAAAGDAETAELERRQRVYEHYAYGKPGIRL